MKASRSAWIRIVLLILYVSTTVFITQGNYVGYMFRLAVVQWLRCCATSRKVAGSIPGGVVGIFR